MRDGSIARWIYAAALALLLVACSRDLSAPELLQQAKDQYAKGNLQTAFIQLKNALIKEPKNADARFLLGRLYNEVGDARSAEKELRLAKQLGLIEAGHVDAALGQALAAEEKYQAVIDEIKPSPAFDAAGMAGVYAARGNAYLSLGKLPEAKKAFEEANLAIADYPRTLLGYARIALIERKRDAALTIVEQVVKVSPRYFDAWMMKGDLLHTDQKIPEAIAAYGEAVKIYPSNIFARASRASSYLNAGKFAEAQADVNAAKQFSPRHPLLNFTQAFIFYRQSKFREAQSAIQDALRVAPDHGPSMLLAGAIYYALGSYAQAESALVRFIARYPRNSMARKLLASSLIELNRPKQALEVIGPLTKDAQDSIMLALAGSASLNAGDFSGATEMLERAVAADPKNAELRSGLGQSYLAKGDVERAIGEFEAATELTSTLGRANVMLVITYLRNREYDKALEALARFEAKDPKSPAVPYLRGVALVAKEDVAGARKSFEKALSLQATYFPAVDRLATLLVKERNFGGAKKVYEEFLEKNKDHLGALLALARLEAANNDHKSTVALLERARAAHPRAVAPRVELAAFYLKTGQPQQASVIAFEAEKIAPNDPVVLEQVGAAQLANGEASSAVVTFTALARQQPVSVVARTGLGFASMRLKHFKEAAGYFRQALKLAPNRYEIMIALTESLRSGKNYDEAIRAARELQKAHPALPGGRMLEGDIRYEERKFAEALKLYEAAFEVDKSGELLVRAYQAQARAGDRAGALARLERWVKENPGDALPRSRLGEAMLLAGNYKAAAEHYLVLVEASPKDGLSLNNLAIALLQLNDPRALEFAERALKAAPTDPLVLDTYGWILVSRNRARDAIPYLDRAAAQLTAVPEVRYHLGAALAKAGEQGRAKRELERALAGGKPFPGINEAKSLLSQL